MHILGQNRSEETVQIMEQSDRDLLCFGLNIFISYYNYTSIQIYVMIIQAMGLERKLKAYKVLLPNMKYLHKLWRIPVYSRKIGTMSNQI